MIKPATWCDAGSCGLTQANLTLAIVTFGEPNATDLAASIPHHRRVSSKSVTRGSLFTIGDNYVDGHSR
jgi:hypothetical protein